VDDASHTSSLTARLGATLGLDVEHIDVRRQLVAASAWTRGSPQRQRVDCLPERAADRVAQPPIPALG
jgi:hypothetical protein